MTLASFRWSASRALGFGQRPTTNAQRRFAPARFRAPQDLYRSQSNDPVRRGVLRFPNCARPCPPLRRYTSHRVGWLKSRSLLLKEPERVSHHAQPPEGCLLNPRPLDAQFVERLCIVRRNLVFQNLLAIRIQVADFQILLIAHHRYIAL